VTYKGNVIVDSVSHVYNFDESNLIEERGRNFVSSTYHHSKLYQPEEYHMTEAEFFKEHEVDEVAEVMFLESDVDFTIHHSLPIIDFFRDGMSGSEKGRRFREKYPNRVALYESVNPISNDAMEQVEYAADDLQADGIKLYPARYRNGRDLRVALDDEIVRAVLDKAVEHGVETVAVHKALPIGPTQTDFYKLDDVDAVADEYSDLNFEIVHAGLAFLEDTIFLLAKHPNVYANLEITANLLLVQPRKFAKVLGEMLLWAGPDRILFASGCVLNHPQPVIEAFWDYQFPGDMREDYGYPELTDEIKAKILGENALRMLGRDPEQVLQETADDEWARAREDLDGRPEPWSSISPTGERP
jgi:predicted TIM-barrel fold metal-dependent hydrolase